MEYIPKIMTCVCYNCSKLLLNKDDVLVYADAGSTFPQNSIMKYYTKNKLNEYFELVSDGTGCFICTYWSRIYQTRASSRNRR